MQPFTMYAWDVDLADSGRSGVTTDRDIAIRRVHEALSDSDPGASGAVRHVALDPQGHPRYVNLRTICEGWRSETVGGVIWRDGK